jgi:hypothetical protein
LFIDMFPNFGKGRILKKEMLESLRDYPRDYLDICFKDYSNGIISGADILVGENGITVSRGVVKHNNRIYMLVKDYELDCQHTNKEVLIKIKFLDGTEAGDFKLYSTIVFIDQNTALKEDELELGRFKLREGAVLRSDYTDFFDLITEYNTINVINVEYAGIKESTMNPFVLKKFSRILLECGSLNTYDIVFAMQCLNSPTVERDVLICYIANRLGVEYKKYSNMEIYKHLCSIVKEVKSGKKRHVEPKKEGPMRIIVD